MRISDWSSDVCSSDLMPGLLGDEWTPEQGRQVMLLEEFIAPRLEPAGGGFALPLAPLRQKSALLHGHCHPTAFNAVAPLQAVLGLVPDLPVDPIDPSFLRLPAPFASLSVPPGLLLRYIGLSLLVYI